MTRTHDPRTSVADVKLSTVQTNVTVILRPISDDTRQDQTNDKLTWVVGARSVSAEDISASIVVSVPAGTSSKRTLRGAVPPVDFRPVFFFPLAIIKKMEERRKKRWLINKHAAAAACNTEATQSHDQFVTTESKAISTCNNWINRKMCTLKPGIY